MTATTALDRGPRGKGIVLAAAAVGTSAALGLLFDVVPRLQAIAFGLLFVAFCGVVLTYEGFRNGRRNLFSPLFLITAYHAIGFGIKGVFDLLIGESKIGRVVDPTSPQFASLMLEVFAYATLGIASYVCGDRLARRREKELPLAPLRPLLDQRSAIVAAAVGTCLTLFGISVLVLRFGTVVFTDPSFIAVEGTFGLFWIYPLMHACVYGWALPIANRWSAHASASAWQILAMLVASIAVYAVTSSKAILVIAAMILVIARHRAVQPVRLTVLFSLGLGFLLALPLLYLHRQFGFTAESLSHVTPDIAWAGAQIFLGRSYLADSFSAVLMYTPRVYPYRLGATWLELFYFWIPRSVWPSKPLSSSLEFGHTYLSSFLDRREAYYSPTLLGDAYLNLGPVGIVIVFFVLGYLLRRWYRWACGPGAGPETVVIYAVSAYWIAVGAEQSLAVIAGLAISYMVIVAFLGSLARRGPQIARFMTRRDPISPH